MGELVVLHSAVAMGAKLLSYRWTSADVLVWRTKDMAGQMLDFGPKISMRAPVRARSVPKCIPGSIRCGAKCRWTFVALTLGLATPTKH